MKLLRCDMNGDKRFCDAFAKVNTGTGTDTIKNCFEYSQNEFYFVFNGKKYPNEYLTLFYKFLWLEYFEQNPDLLDFASEFDDFVGDKSADVIRDIMKKGKEAVLEECADFISFLNQNGLYVIERDIFKSVQDIICHQVNCYGKMGAGIAYVIKKKYPEVNIEYIRHCKSKKKNDLLGDCLILKGNDGRYIANLFGQLKPVGFSFGKKVYTDYDALRKSFLSLKEFAVKNRLSIAIPYRIGCGIANGDWDTVQNIISDVFCDYPVVLYNI